MKNKIIALFIAAALTGGVFAGCGDSSKTVSDVAESEAIETSEGVFEVELEVVCDKNGGKPIFTVETNLPDDTKIMLTLTGGDDYTGQSSFYIEDGTATSDAFSSQGNPLSGNYTLSVSTPVMSVQDNSVKEILGDSGENMTGEYVVESSTGSGYVVKAEFDFTF